MEKQRDFFEKVLFRKIKEEGIKEVVQLGDILDNRTGISFMTSRFLFEFLEWFDRNDVQLVVLAGNHDTFYRNTLEIVGIRQFESMFKNVKVVTEPTLLHENLVLVPWICDSNKDAALEFIERHGNGERFLFGHFELKDFPVNRSIVSGTGQFEPDILEGYRKVFSGHFHTPSEKGNIVYVGTPYEITWNDHGDQKRFFVLDRSTGETEMVPLKEKIFVSVLYDESLLSSDLSVFEGKILKVVLTEDFDATKYDIFLQRLEQKGKPYMVQTIDARQNDLIQTIEEGLDGVVLESPLEIVSRTVSSMSLDDADKTFILDEINTIYKFAMEQNDKTL